MRKQHALGAVRAAALVAVVSFVMAACGGSSIPSGTDPFQQPPTISETPPPPIQGSAGSCVPGSPKQVLEQGIEYQGVKANGRPVYALFATHSIQPVTPVTVGWEVAGDGGFQVTLIGPDGRIDHESVMHPGELPGWSRPGEPWTGQITFPTAGCWRVYFVRGSEAGDLWVQVTL